MIMTIQAWSLKVRDFTVPPRQPSLGAIAPRDGCLGGTVKSLTFRLHGSIVPIKLQRSVNASQNLKEKRDSFGKALYN